MKITLDIPERLWADLSAEARQSETPVETFLLRLLADGTALTPKWRPPQTSEEIEAAERETDARLFHSGVGLTNEDLRRENMYL